MKGTEAEQSDLAHATLEEHWGLSATMRRLPGENHNYLAELDSGDPVVLKIFTESHADPALEDVMISTLHKAGLPVPRIIPSTSGQDIVTIEELTPAGHRKVLGLARVQEYLPGTPWKSMESTPSRLKAIGAFMATMHLQLATIECSTDAGWTHEWDLATASEHRDLSKYVVDSEQRHRIEYCFHLYSALVGDRWSVGTPSFAGLKLDDCPSGLLHGDINDENLLLEEDRVVGLLDFGDSLHGAFVQDLWIALAYALEQDGVTLESAASLVQGYDECRPLVLAEQDLLFPLALARLAPSPPTKRRVARRHAHAARRTRRRSVT